MPTVRRATLDNGLRVVAVEMPHMSYASVRLVVGAGSRDDQRTAWQMFEAALGD